MPEKRYFLHLTGAVLLGLITLAIAAALVFLLMPYIIPFFASLLPFLAGLALVVVVVIVIWIIIFIAAVIGVAIYYVIKHPMEVSEKPGTYGLEHVKEAGKREKGETEEKEEEE